MFFYLFISFLRQFRKFSADRTQKIETSEALLSDTIIMFGDFSAQSVQLGVKKWQNNKETLL